MRQEASNHALEPRDIGRPALSMDAPSRSVPVPEIKAPEVSLDISHELRTSLAIITLLSGNLDLLYGRLQDAERRKLIRDVRSQIKKLNELVADVLCLLGDKGAPSM